MRTMISLLVLGACLGLASRAAAGPVDAPEFPKAFSCSACHGLGGASRADAMPVLAGMHPDYFMKAVFDYAAGRRPSAEMEPFGRLSLELGAEDLARYFAGQPFQPSPTTVDAAAAARGRTAAEKCATCHGAQGQGDPGKVIPRLAGQPAGYLRNQMMLFKQDARSPGDAPLREMKKLMKEIPDATLADLAAYYSSLR